MPVPPSGYGSAVLHWSIAGGAKPYTVTAGWGSGTVTGTTAQDVADAWFLALTTTGRPCAAENMLTGWTFQGVSTEGQDGSVIHTGAHFENVVGTASLGSPPGDLADPFNPVVISKRTAFGGRPYRGRMYVPPIIMTTGNIDPNGIILSGLVTSTQSRWSAFLVDIAGDPDSQMRLLHTPSLGISPPTIVTSLIVRNVVGSQRRRKARAS